MKFNIGDKVRFLNEKGDGVVSKIINKTTVGVTIEDGFELPFTISELVAIYDQSQAPINIKKEEPVLVQVPIVSKSAERKKVQEGIYLGLTPENTRDISYSDFNLWFINHSEYDVLYCVSSLLSSGYRLIEKGEAKAFESKLIETISKKKLDEYTTLKVDVLFYNATDFEHQAPVSEIIKIKQPKLYKENVFVENTFIPEKAFIMPISRLGEELFFDNPEAKSIDLSKLFIQKQQHIQSKKVSKPHTKNSSNQEMEIDLHIEELMDDYSGMSNAQIIQIQLRHFQQALDTAINEHCRKLIVIHGVGNGRLKQEVRSLLTSSNMRFYDGSYSKYGFGATEVVIH
jgi:hypothetical protein